jgi:ubiquinone/menaquinone biosynthesis C-methylase UbiE
MSGHRFFAAIYDRLMASSEEAGLEEIRSELLAEANGRVVELGAGTGLNLSHYTSAVDELVLTEPDPHMARRMHDRIAGEPPQVGRVEVVEAPAEQLPVEDASADVVVSTLVLCTVEDPDRAAAEAERVLRPGGRLLFMEHVLSEDSPRLARWQHRLERPWGWVAGGCHPNRETARTLDGAGLGVAANEGEFPKAPPLARPLIHGVATKPAG